MISDTLGVYALRFALSILYLSIRALYIMYISSFQQPIPQWVAYCLPQLQIITHVLLFSQYHHLQARYHESTNNALILKIQIIHLSLKMGDTRESSGPRSFNTPINAFFQAHAFRSSPVQSNSQTQNEIPTIS